MSEVDVSGADVAAGIGAGQTGADPHAAQPSRQTAADDAGGQWAEALAEQASMEESAQRESEQSEAAQPQVQAFADIAEVPQVHPAKDGVAAHAAPAPALTDMELIADIPVQLSVELGRTRMTIKQILQLGRGSVIELDSQAGQPMDIYINGHLIAQGEVVVVDERYGIRLTDIITPAERLSRLNGRR